MGCGNCGSSHDGGSCTSPGCGSNGDCSTMSFHATKSFHTAEGGAVACRDADIAERIALDTALWDLRGRLEGEFYLDGHLVCLKVGVRMQLSNVLRFLFYKDGLDQCPDLRQPA